MENVTVKRKMKVRKLASDKVFDVVNAIIMISLIILVVVPLLYLIAMAFSDYRANSDVTFIPLIVNNAGQIMPGITFENFEFILKYEDGLFLTSFKNTAIITVCVTFGSNILMALAAYPLSKTNLPFRKGFLVFFIIVMLFSAGIVPSLILMNEFNLTNIVGLILISLTNVFNLLLFKTTFEGIPKELEESAQLDGANPLQMFFKIIIPITIPTFASCCFFTLVGCINSYSGALLFLNQNDTANKPMALVLYELMATIKTAGASNTELALKAFNVQAAGIILSVIPILCVYPFIIRYIKTGVTLGSVKG